MQIDVPAIILTARPHGEHGAIVSALTEGNGRLMGYVRGGRGRTSRAVLLPSNMVQAQFRARTAEQMAGLSVELIDSRAAIMGEPLAAATVQWVTVLSDFVLPERQPYPRVFQALSGLIGAIAAAPVARNWAPSLVRYELLVLAELGYGLDLAQCVQTGADTDLAFVSPRSGGAVSEVAGAAWADKLFRLPDFLVHGGQADWADIRDGLSITGHFLERHFPVERGGDIYAVRARLFDRILALSA